MTRGKAAVFWFTGLSGAGKTTLAEKARLRLGEDGINSNIVDGDQVRSQLHRHLGFSEADIKQNNALIADLCASLRDRYDVILVPIISPFAESRAQARAQLQPGFFEIFVNARLETVVARDTKSLYAKAKAGIIRNLVGFSPGAPYEPPEHPDLIIDTTIRSEEAAVAELVSFIRERRRERFTAETG